MKEKIKNIFIGILIGLIAFPTFTLGGIFVVSLIQGKSVEEAVQILAEQIDVLIGRIEKGEEKQQVIQTQLEKVEEEKQLIQAQLEKEKACNEYNSRILAEIKNTCGTFPYSGINACIWYFEELLAKIHGVEYQERLNKLKELKPQYLDTAEKCGISLEEEYQLSEKWIAEFSCLNFDKQCLKLPSNLMCSVYKDYCCKYSEKVQSDSRFSWVKEYCTR